VEEVGSSEIGSSWKVSLSENVMLVLLTVEVGTVKEDSGLLPSRQVLGRAITACAIGACSIKLPSRRVPSRRVPLRRVPSGRVPLRWILGRAVKVSAGS
jgi:hypothetical protein